LALTSLILALAGSLALGGAAWASLAAIEFDSSPFSTAKWWFAAGLVAAAAPVASLVVAIVALARRAGRLGWVSLAVAVTLPAAAFSFGLDLGADALVRHAAQSALQFGGGFLPEQTPDWLLPLLDLALRRAL
jgi:hypothetical protein